MDPFILWMMKLLMKILTQYLDTCIQSRHGFVLLKIKINNIFDDNIGKIGLRVSSISETSIKLSEDGLTILGETYSTDDDLYQVLEQGEIRYGLFP